MTTPEPTEQVRVPPPLYPQVHVESVDELLEWIRTVDVETFQSGRYIAVVSLLRTVGKTIVPSFDIPGVESFGMTVLQDDVLPMGRTAISYAYLAPSGERLFVSVSTLTSDQVEQGSRSICEYAATLDEAWHDAMLSEATIQIITEDGIRTETVQTLTYSASDNPDMVGWIPSKSIMFLVGDFQIMLRQDRDVFNADFLNLLQLEVISIELDTTTPPSSPESPGIAWPEDLPRHVPGSITLRPDGYLEAMFDLPFTLRHRAVFYSIPADIERMVDDPEASIWVDENILREADPTVMPLAAFIQRFNIQKEDFVAVVEEMRKNAIASGFDLYDEDFELPNADIIFTFDNELISHFYRRA